MYRFGCDMYDQQAHLDRVKELMPRQQHYNLARILDPHFPDLEKIEQWEEAYKQKLL